MSRFRFPKVEINGAAADAEQLHTPAIVNYGHFTAMQVRDGRVRGADLHLQRLTSATRDLFGTDLDSGFVWDCLRHAIGDARDASVRIDVFTPRQHHEPSVMVTVRPPAAAPSTPQRLLPVPYLRPVAHIKHVGTFGQIYFGHLAERDGFDDALLTGPGGVIAESGIANIGFFTGTEVVWPNAPALEGITKQLLLARLADHSVAAGHREVRLAEVGSYTSAFLTNSTGIVAVGAIGAEELTVDPEMVRRLNEIYEAVPWDPI